MTKVYVDGVQNESAEFGKYTVGGLIKDSLPGGGTLDVLPVYSQVVYVSELNLWDKALSAVEISESSKLCFGKQGNVKKWSDFWPGFSKDKSRYEAPSQCKSPNGSSEEMMWSQKRKEELSNTQERDKEKIPPSSFNVILRMKRRSLRCQEKLQRSPRLTRTQAFTGRYAKQNVHAVFKISLQLNA